MWYVLAALSPKYLVVKRSSDYAQQLHRMNLMVKKESRKKKI